MKKFIPPELDLTDIVDISTLSRDELKKVPGEKWRLYCGVAGCSHYTNVMRYASRTWCSAIQGGIWMDITHQYFICFQHYRQYRLKMDELPQKEGPKINYITKTINHPEFPNK